MAQLKLILLDFDGTLANTREANALGYITALREVGIELSKEEYFARYFGMRCMEFMRSVGVEDEGAARKIRRRKIKKRRSSDGSKGNFEKCSYCSS